MSAHKLSEFLPPGFRQENDERAGQDWRQGVTRVPEVLSPAPQNVPSVRKRHLRVAAWAEGVRAEVPIVERYS